jgi:RNA polymerase sigma-70 factor (ECF subfamily)
LLGISHRELDAGLRAKVAPSDLVQDTFLEAQHAFPRFQGSTEAELCAWLGSILRHNVTDLRRRYHASQKRDVLREVSLDQAARAELQASLLAADQSPSKQAVAREQDQALHRALTRLPELYRKVLTWRSYERCSFEEVGRRLDRTPEAARKLWSRAVEQLQRLLESGA